MTTLRASFNLIVAALFGAVLLVTAQTQPGDLDTGGFVAQGALGIAQAQATAAEKPFNIPTWDDGYASEFPGCSPMVEGEVTDEVLVVRLSGAVERMSFDSAWSAAADPTWGNDVWVVGSC